MKRFLSLALPVAFALAVTGCTAASPGSAPSSSPTPSTSASASANASDVMFVQMMIPHHEQAVVMSDSILAKQGIATDVTTLATQIKAAQQPEIEQMQGWLQAWGAPASAGHSGMGGMGGMLSEAELAALDDAQGVEAEKLFLNGMIGHHEGAVDMATQVQANGTDPQVRALAAQIITSQQAEIEQMKQMLATRG